MKLGIIGMGGIGSYFLEEVCICMDQLQLQDIEVTIFDDDIVELNQVKYQNFSVKDTGHNKAKVLAKKFGGHGIVAITKRITKDSELKDYDVIISCVDNYKARKLVTEYCHNNNKEFLDLRATGRKVFCTPKLKTLSENLKYIDENDTATYSCQDKSDLAKGYVQKGNKIAAMIGVQMLLNIDRGHDNHLINIVI